MSDESTEARAEQSQVPWSRRQPQQAAALYIGAYLLVALIGGQAVARMSSLLAIGVAVTVIATIVLALSLLVVLSICRIPI